MENNELLQAISDMMDKKFDDRLKPINDRLDKVDDRLDNMDSRLNKVDDRLDNIELQIKHTERNLRAAIIDSENLILDEVSRVHRILNKHKDDTSKHIA